jgi:hypothetical protein
MTYSGQKRTKIKIFFYYSFHILEYKIAIKCQKFYLTKKILFGMAPFGSHRIRPSGQKKKFKQIWKEGILINYKNSKNFVFDKNYNSMKLCTLAIKHISMNPNTNHTLLFFPPKNLPLRKLGKHSVNLQLMVIRVINFHFIHCHLWWNFCIFLDFTFKKTKFGLFGLVIINHKCDI